MDVYGIKDFPEVKIGGKIKENAEDFIVEEIRPSGKLCSTGYSFFEKIVDFLPKKRLEHLHFTLVKRNYTVQRAISQISDRLHIGPKRFGYAGTKDKKAVTSQRISVWNQSIKDLKKLKMRDIIIKNYEYSDERLNLGDLSANQFTLTIRDIKIPVDKIKDKIELFEKEIALGLPNYFGPQRFGMQRPINHLIGKNLLLGDFEKAAELLICEPGNESPEAADAREFAKKNWGKWREILEIWPKHLGVEAAVLNYLVQYPTDYANSFRRLPKNLRRMLIHAVQSYVFNRVLTRIMEDKDSFPEVLPLIGYNTNTEHAAGALTNRILEEMGLRKEMFRLNKMPELAEQGSERETTVEVEHFSVIDVRDSILKIKFVLGKGSYATILLKVLLGEYYG